jgi:hypothetical protein
MTRPVAAGRELGPQTASRIAPLATRPGRVFLGNKIRKIGPVPEIDVKFSNGRL